MICGTQREVVFNQEIRKSSSAFTTFWFKFAVAEKNHKTFEDLRI